MIKIYWRISDTIQNLVKFTSCLPTLLLFTCIQFLFKWSHLTIIVSKTITLCWMQYYRKIFKNKKGFLLDLILHYAKTIDFHQKEVKWKFLSKLRNSIMSTRYQIICKNHCIIPKYEKCNCNWYIQICCKNAKLLHLYSFQFISI